MKDDANFYLSAFHANVDRSEDTSIRQRYTQDLPLPLYIFFLCHTFFYIIYTY